MMQMTWKWPIIASFRKEFEQGKGCAPFPQTLFMKEILKHGKNEKGTIR